ncbi:formate/nitrite transporter family protein [Longimicrobium sp.]|uniref:formate/nitrite transporter family protein n=1 Tax=Longimicrobium sp. TaxID=2029185 RepID=UPI002B6F06F9|nr:formate/nitrite transporter family protein [Longimicrobium sp.]HSU13701.1 formate/nitrite transporter family protein [Longimicrobium sp.]
MAESSEEHQGKDEDRPEGAPELKQSEEKKAEEEKSLSADITYEVIRREGDDELERSTGALAWSGFAAGLAMGFSLVAEGVIRSHLPAGAAWAPLVSKLGYSFGFLIVILGSQQLFTENTLTAVVPLMARRTREVFGHVARLWGVVLLANLLGALAFAFVIGRTELFRPEVHHAFREIAMKAVEAGFWLTVLKAVFAGWLIALLVWMLPAAETSHVLVIVLMTWLVGVGEFAHIVAGAVEVFYLGVTGALGWGEVFGRFIIPTLIGNVLGGVTLVSALNHAQVTAGGGKPHG